MVVESPRNLLLELLLTTNSNIKITEAIMTAAAKRGY